MSDSAEVIVVGAGLAGLCAAVQLQLCGKEVIVIEAGDDVGGRVRTDELHGFQLDRGFQVFNTAYPEAMRMLDFDRLDLRPFFPGVAVYFEGKRHLLGNPLRRPASLPSTMAAPVGSLLAKSRLGVLSAAAAVTPARLLKRRPDRRVSEALARFGLSGTIEHRLVRPFLSGVLLDGELVTSARFAQLVWRSFARGQICVPAAGMGAIPAQLAGRLEAGTLRLNTQALRVTPTEVVIEGGRTLTARAVLVATDPVTAGAFLPSIKPPPMRGVTTFYHQANESPLQTPVLILDGEERLVVNTVVLTAASPSYGADGATLISTSVLGTDPDPAIERLVRGRLAVLYGVDTSSWEQIATYAIPDALPTQLVGQSLRQAVRIDRGLYVCGDHRDTPSIQGAMVSGRRAATAVLADLDPEVLPRS